VAKNVPPRTIVARENIATEAKVSEVSKVADAAKTADATKTADVSKVTDYRIPSPIIQIQRVGPPDPTVTVGHKNTTAAN
jgi:hypothetical protein